MLFFISALFNTLQFFMFIAVVNVKTASPLLILTIIDPKGTKLQTLHSDAEMRHHFAAFYSGNYQICI